MLVKRWADKSSGGLAILLNQSMCLPEEKMLSEGGMKYRERTLTS